LRPGNDVDGVREGAIIVVVQWGGLSSPDVREREGKKTIRDGNVRIWKMGLPFLGAFPQLLRLLEDAGRGAVLAVLVGCRLSNTRKQVSDSKKNRSMKILTSSSLA
jgi:hypothetical protein